MVIHTGLSLRTTLLHCKDYIVAVSNEWAHINYWKLCFALVGLLLTRNLFI